MIILFAGGVFVVAAALPGIRRLIGFPEYGWQVPETTAPIRLWRVMFVNLIVVWFVGGSLLLVVTERYEFWPILRYPIYANARSLPYYQTYRFYGILGDDREFPLSKPEYVYPFGMTKLETSLGRILRKRPGAAEMKEVLSDVLGRYESLRLAGRHDGPKLSGIRLYRVRWDVDPWARNYPEPATAKTLLFELITTASNRGKVD